MRRKGSYRGMADINITSLVDVTLTLLIIFMLTAPYIQGGVEVKGFVDFAGGCVA